MNHYKNNFHIAVNALNTARNDHYDGVNAIYRLAACLKIPKKTSPDGVNRQVKKLVKELSKLEVRPNRINVFDNMLEIDWYPKGYQMVMNRGQYAGLMLEFAEYLNDSKIWGLFIQDGCFDDDPEDSVKGVSNDMIHFFPEFNAACFGAEDHESIKIMDFTSQNNYQGVA